MSPWTPLRGRVRGRASIRIRPPISRGRARLQCDVRERRDTDIARSLCVTPWSSREPETTSLDDAPAACRVGSDVVISRVPEPPIGRCPDAARPPPYSFGGVPDHVRSGNVTGPLQCRRSLVEPASLEAGRAHGCQAARHSDLEWHRMALDATVKTSGQTCALKAVDFPLDNCFKPESERFRLNT